MKSKILSYIVAIIIILVTTRCEEESTCFKCVYEKRESTGCNTSSYTAWVAESGPTTNTDDIKSGLSKQGYCDLVYPPNDTECAGGCCVQFQFRNVKSIDC